MLTYKLSTHSDTSSQSQSIFKDFEDLLDHWIVGVGLRRSLVSEAVAVSWILH